MALTVFCARNQCSSRRTGAGRMRSALCAGIVSCDNFAGCLFLTVCVFCCPIGPKKESLFSLLFFCVAPLYTTLPYSESHSANARTYIPDKSNSDHVASTESSCRVRLLHDCALSGGGDHVPEQMCCRRCLRLGFNC